MKKSLKWQIAQQIELKWWQRYFSRKNKEEYIAWKKAYWQKVLNSIRNNIALEKAEYILDAGCGPAGIFLLFQNKKTTATDPLLDKYDAQLDFFNKSEYPSVNFVNAPLESYLRPEEFDIVFCMNAINHVSHLEQSLKNLFLNTKSGGELVLSIDAHNYSLLKWLLRLIPGDVLHPHQYDLKDYINFVKEAGFTVKTHFKIKKELIFDHYILIAEK